MMDNKINMEDFKKNYKSAKGFHHRAEQFSREGWDSVVIFNVASMALESYLVALCNLYGVMPMGHTYGYLVDSAETVVDVPSSLDDEIRSLDPIFNEYLCSLESYDSSILKLLDSDKLISICNEVSKLFNQEKISSICG
ncbi:hypothetical protein CLLU_21800 [Clostridium luticellarii]|jgi:hypothetical protein|uniref:HEPN domain-containing protein n=2 Tax=Clostridium luticellarii TaxID=1691940 RepID=A0A2T0BLT6_9CLOT|nr:hypothetical protein CLLU_21800 [Clostridium luticellarii]